MAVNASDIFEISLFSCTDSEWVGGGGGGGGELPGGHKCTRQRSHGQLVTFILKCNVLLFRSLLNYPLSCFFVPV